MCEPYTLSVKPSDNPTLYKDKIISALYQHPTVDNQIKQICYRNFIKPETHVWEDVKQEAFYHLCKKEPNEIISLYESDPKRLLGLTIKIAILKGVASNSKDPDYPKHSIAKYILFASNLGKHEFLSPTGEKDAGEFVQVGLHPDTLPDNIKEMWETINAELSPDEIVFMEEHFNRIPQRGGFKKEYKNKYNNLLLSIERIIKKHKFNV